MALIASTIERNARVSRIIVRIRMKANTYGKLPNNACTKSRSTRGEPVIRPPSSSRSRSTIPWMPGAEPSIAAKPSTSEFCPLRHSGGAVAPTTPRTAVSFAHLLASPPFSTRTLSGLMTPRLIPAAASWSRAAIAEPVPGKFFICASLGFSCVPSPANAATITRPTAATATGRRITKRAQRPHLPSSGCPLSMKRFGMTRTLLMRVPSTGCRLRTQWSAEKGASKFSQARAVCVVTDGVLATRCVGTEVDARCERASPLR